MQMWHLPAIFAADLLVGFYFFRKEQLCANPIVSSSALRVLHSFGGASGSTPWYWKQPSPSWESRMFGVYREFWAKIRVMQIKIRKLTLGLINGGEKKQKQESITTNGSWL